ncbi:MAG: VWA domain-containing protein, partial [Planctomycetes bacterium]|nr:VWA domain-containing protein [Planctomycetota bacterium]
ALGFIEGLYAGGSTNIDQALNTALSQLQDSKSPNYVIFLTDGLPTAGETNEMKIVDNAKKENRVRARIFTFGVGYDVNSRLLDRLVRANFGQGEYVRPDEDIEERVSRFYGRIKAPVMTDVSVKFVVDEKDEEGKSINRVYPEDAFDLFAGEQLVVVGRYKKPGDAKVTVAGRIGKNKESFDFPAKLVKKSSDDTNAFVEKLWAVRRIGEILDEIDLSGKNDELVEELVKLSTRHGILTPYTAFMADENTRVHDLAANTARTDLHLGALSNSSGAGGFMQREAKARFKAAGQGAAAPSAPGKYYARGSFDQALRSVPGAKLPAATMPRPAGRPSVAGPGMGYGGGRIAGQTPRADGDELSSEEAAAAAVRNVGNKTFFRRAERWVDSSVTESQEKNVQQVKQFSREYFDLARRFGQQFSQYLVFDETVVVEFKGQAYEILPEGS